MSEQITKKDKKDFYKISKYMLFYYIALFVFSIITSLLSYFGASDSQSKICKYISMGISVTSSLMVIIFWFVGRKQQECLETIMKPKTAWIMNVIIDLFELAYVCLNTVSSLYNGGLMVESFNKAMPAISLLLMLSSAFDFILALAFVIKAKKKVKNQK